MSMKQAANVDDYIAGFPQEIQILLNGLRAVVIKAAPMADESISYGMPGYKLHGPLVYFGGFKNHISLFPAGSILEEFEQKIVPYKTSKGTLQFPLNKPLPLQLIGQIVKYRVKENNEKAALKKRK
jgi:uncharacterized protein YdhG (YjbR/CyaY superfamily)